LPDVEAVRRLVSFDIDGTLETGSPPGPITIEVVRRVQANGWLIGSCSDKTATAQRLMWKTCGVVTDFAVVKHQLTVVRAQFEAGVYLHIGDTDVDRFYAEQAGFDFLHVNDATFAARLLELSTILSR
jgi:hypothetical protein